MQHQRFHSQCLLSRCPVKGVFMMENRLTCNRNKFLVCAHRVISYQVLVLSLLTAKQAANVRLHKSQNHVRLTLYAYHFQNVLCFVTAIQCIVYCCTDYGMACVCLPFVVNLTIDLVFSPNMWYWWICVRYHGSVPTYWISHSQNSNPHDRGGGGFNSNSGTGESLSHGCHVTTRVGLSVSTSWRSEMSGADESTLLKGMQQVHTPKVVCIPM